MRNVQILIVSVVKICKQCKVFRLPRRPWATTPMKLSGVATASLAGNVSEVQIQQCSSSQDMGFIRSLCMNATLLDTIMFSIHNAVINTDKNVSVFIQGEM